MKTTQMLNWQTLLHPYNGVLLNSLLAREKKEWSIDTHNKMDKPKLHYAQWKKLDSNNDISEKAKVYR